MSVFDSGTAEWEPQGQDNSQRSTRHLRGISVRPTTTARMLKRKDKESTVKGSAKINKWVLFFCVCLGYCISVMSSLHLFFQSRLLCHVSSASQCPLSLCVPEFSCLPVKAKINTPGESRVTTLESLKCLPVFFLKTELRFTLVTLWCGKKSTGASGE